MSDKPWRPLALVMLGLGFAALLAAVAWAAYARQEAYGSRSVGDSLPYVALAVDKSLGINTDLSRLGIAEREDVLAAMEAAGARWLRQRFPWDAIESEQGVYDWTIWDPIIEDIDRHNLKIIAVLDGSPVWARTGQDVDNPLAPPVETRDFGDFVSAFAARYGGLIDHYQVWNEPNIAPHWGAREIDPAAYGYLLREGAIRIRAADSGSTILLAALAPNVEAGGANMSELMFLDALYQEGAEEWFDVVAAQPYNLEDPVEASSDPERLNWRRVALVRDVMEAHGDMEAAIWAVSFGLRDVAPEKIADALEQSRQDWPWLGPMLWAAWSPNDINGEYAMSDGVYTALTDLATAPSVAWPGVYPADNSSGRYEGDWRVTPSGSDIGGSGDRLTIPFWGTRLDLTLRRGDYRAFLYVTVDGRPANALPRDGDDRAYIVLYDPLQGVDTVIAARNLPAANHTAEIVADRGWGQWAIVDWRVSQELPSRLPWLPVGLGLAAFAVLGVTLYGAWIYRGSVLDTVSALVARYHALGDGVVLAITAGAAVLVYVMVGTIPTLATLALLALLLLLRPEMGLPLIAVALPFYQLGRSMLGKTFSMIEILTLLTAVGWLVNFVMVGLRTGLQENGRTDKVPRIENLKRQVTSLDLGVFALVCLGALSLLWAEHVRVATREFRTVLLESAVFYGLLRTMVRSDHEVSVRSTEGRARRALWRVTDAWVLGGALIGLVGFFQWLLGQNLITAEGVWRVRGFYGSPNNLALYLGKVFPLALALAIWARKGRRRWGYGLAALAMAVAIVLTYSRGAWLVGVPISLLFLAVMRGRRTLAVTFSLLVVAGVVGLFILGPGRLASLLDTSTGTSAFRLQLWQSSWSMIREHLLLGVGLDNFLYHYRTYYVLPTAWQEFNLSHPHNLILDFWLRLGLSGLIVLLWLLVAFFRRGWNTYNRMLESDEKLLVLGLMAGMVNLVAHGVVDNAFFLVDLSFVFMLLLALLQSTDHGSETSVVMNSTIRSGLPVG